MVGRLGSRGRRRIGLLRRTQLLGVALGSLVMAAATATTLIAGEPGRSLAPLVVLAALALVAALTSIAKRKERA